ncbi:hypothetical protein FNI96_26145 [Salmonella enterica subsp. diarizonae]|nr:hypothetical protein [Salmonella enterica subsp. diarizonae]
MNVFEMEGFLRGKCIPRDLKVNETNAEYLVRKFAEAEAKCAALSAKLSMINDLTEAAEQANKQAQEATEKLVQERNALATENAGLKSAAIEAKGEMEEHHDADQMYSYDADGEQMDALLRLCDAQGAIDEIVLSIKTPATDAFLAEMRASAIPEGYALVPQQIFLEPSDIELICSQCGDGHESGYGDFTDGLLWVGNIQRDDGSIVHGLHISSADYTEEGGVTVCEFAAQPRKGVAL